MSRELPDLALLRRLRAGLSAHEPTVTVRPIVVGRGYNASQKMREDLELMAWSLSRSGLLPW